jgi:hypothetical protein
MSETPKETISLDGYNTISREAFALGARWMAREGGTVCGITHQDIAEKARAFYPPIASVSVDANGAGPETIGGFRVVVDPNMPPGEAKIVQVNEWPQPPRTVARIINLESDDVAQIATDSGHIVSVDTSVFRAQGNAL